VVPGEVTDVLVVGAGINGAAVAREAVLQGLRVVLVEAVDLAAGTSGASSRMIHGGLRYLENGEVRLVRESLAERERLLRTAPHLVRRYPLLIPLYAGNRRGRRTVRAGMACYDLLSPGAPRHRMLSSAQTRLRYPGLATAGLTGAALYHDAAAPAAERLVVEQVLDAVALGATVHTHHRVCALTRGADGLLAAELRGPGGSRTDLRARTVVNCAGPWVDDLAAAADRGRLVGGTKGSHLVVAAFSGAPATGVHYEADDGRAVLVLPQPDGTYLIGSTDLFLTGGPDDHRVTEAEVDYLLAQVNRLVPAAGLGPGDVLSGYCGIRPLPASDAESTAAVSRDHQVVADPALLGLFSVLGGKLTTHRALAEQVLRAVGPRLTGGRPTGPRRPSPTRRLALPGGRCADWPGFRERFLRGTAQPTAVLARLLDLYGVRAARVLELVAADETLARPIAGTTALGAEVAVALREEFATTLTDVMARRLLLGRGPDLGLACAPEVARLCAREGGWSETRTRDELDGYQAWADHQAPPRPHGAGTRRDILRSL
jgi:glycerol-3-phosphate dehydrogenase